MDSYTATTFEEIESEQIKFGKFFDGYRLGNSLNEFEASVEWELFLNIKDWHLPKHGHFLGFVPGF